MVRGNLVPPDLPLPPTLQVWGWQIEKPVLTAIFTVSKIVNESSTTSVSASGSYICTPSLFHYLSCFQCKFQVLFTGQTKCPSGTSNPSFKVRFITIPLKHPSSVIMSCPWLSARKVASSLATPKTPCPSTCILLHLQSIHVAPTAKIPSKNLSWVMSLPAPKLFMCLPTACLYLICVSQSMWSFESKFSHYLMEMLTPGLTNWVWISGITGVLNNQCPINKVQVPLLVSRLSMVSPGGLQASFLAPLPWLPTSTPGYTFLPISHCHISGLWPFWS